MATRRTGDPQRRPGAARAVARRTPAGRGAPAPRGRTDRAAPGRVVAAPDDAWCSARSRRSPGWRVACWRWPVWSGSSPWCPPTSWSTTGPVAGDRAAGRGRRPAHPAGGAGGRRAHRRRPGAAVRAGLRRRAGALAVGRLLIELYQGLASTTRPGVEVLAGDLVVTSSVRTGPGWLLGVLALGLTVLAGVVAVAAFGRTVMEDAGRLDPARPALAGAGVLLGAVTVLCLALPPPTWPTTSSPTRPRGSSPWSRPRVRGRCWSGPGRPCSVASCWPRRWCWPRSCRRPCGPGSPPWAGCSRWASPSCRRGCPGCATRCTPRTWTGRCPDRPAAARPGQHRPGGAGLALAAG